MTIICMVMMFYILLLKFARSRVPDEWTRINCPKSRHVSITLELFVKEQVDGTYKRETRTEQSKSMFHRYFSQIGHATLWPVAKIESDRVFCYKTRRRIFDVPCYPIIRCWIFSNLRFRMYELIFCLPKSR